MVDNMTAEGAVSEKDADYKNLYLAAMNELGEISDVAIAAQQRLEELYLTLTDRSGDSIG